MILNLLCITLIVVFITDHSGIMDTIKRALGKWLRCRVERLMPFDCSLCMTWWSGLLYIAIAEHFTLGNIVAVAFFALMADKVAETITLIRDLYTKLINTIYKLLKL